MTCIETMIIVIVIDVLTIIEFKTGDILEYRGISLFDDDFQNLSAKEIARRRKTREIIEMMKKGEVPDDYEPDKRSTYSLPDRFDKDSVTTEEKALSFPLSPRTEARMMQGEFYAAHA